MSLPEAPRLHLNENLSPRLAEQLRKHGFDVTTSHEMDMLAEPDDVQLAFATAEQRAIVSFNVRDFAPLHDEYQAAGREHWGMIFSTQEPLNILFQRLLRLLNAVSAEDLKNQIRWLNEFQ
ncbi:MAG: DUF5615 family PIN-like protein [Blastocatellia bacterium]|nr:DUF5615 family PIN-like protein [Blastocatellia bacterium]